MVFASKLGRRLAAIAIVITSIKRGRHLVGVARVRINRSVGRVLDVDCNAGDCSGRCHPTESHVTFRHTQLLANGRRGSHSDFFNHGAESVLHLNLTTIPTLEVGGLTHDFPSASRAILISDFRETTFDTIGNEVKAIFVAVKISDIVLKPHHLARNNIFLCEDLNTITKQHNLINVLNGIAAQRNGRIGPTDDTRLRMSVFGLNSQVFNSGNQGIIDVVRNIIKDGSLTLVEATVPARVKSIDGVVVVKRAAPTPVEIELTVALTITATCKGMTTVGIAARIIQREAFFQTGNQHLFPIVFGIEVTVFTSGLVCVTEIVGDGRGNIL